MGGWSLSPPTPQKKYNTRDICLESPFLPILIRYPQTLFPFHLFIHNSVYRVTTMKLLKHHLKNILSPSLRTSHTSGLCQVGSRWQNYSIKQTISCICPQCSIIQHTHPHLIPLIHPVLWRSWHVVLETISGESPFFIVHFSATMHRTTIVQNGIISIICSCVFFWQANIKRPNLKNLLYCRPTSNRYSSSSFHHRMVEQVAFYSGITILHFAFRTFLKYCT